MKLAKRGLWVMCLVVAMAAGLAAQVTTGTILGTVSDASGGVIPGATVTIRNVETGITRTASSDEAGRYRVPQLGLGDYEITAESAGFQTSVRTGVTLTVGREAAVDFAMQVGAVAERITVTGEAPLLETTNATVGGLVDSETLRNLPLVGRSYADLTAIQPGVISNMEITASGTNAVYSGGGSTTRRSIGGTRPQQSTYLLDGFEISTPSSGMPVNSVLGESLGVDAIREFSVLQSNFGAQVGRAAGGVVNAVTQSGTNEFHGTVFEVLRNEKLDARGFFLAPKFAKAPYKRNQFGGALGGPVIKDKAFFFVNYEGVRVRAAENFIGATLTPETWAGTTTGCPTGLTRCSQAQATKAAFKAVNKDILEVWKPLLPLPNGDYLRNGVADYTSTPRWNANENYGIGRFDYQMGENDTLFGRFTKDRSYREDEFSLKTPDPFTGFQVGGYVLAAISQTHIFSPTVINTAKLGFTRRNDNLLYNYSDGGEQFTKPGALDPRLSPVRGVPLGLYSLPGVSIYGGPGPSLSGPVVFVDNAFEYSDTVMINRGRHAVQIGGEFKKYQTNALNEPWIYGGSFTWPDIASFVGNTPRNTTQLLGFHNPPRQHADVYRGWRQTYGSLYFQDDFNLRPGLTVNLGLRWEAISAPLEVNGKLAFLQDVYTSKDFTLLTKEDSFFKINDGLKGLSPRVGIAWNMMSGTVLRGGAGFFKEMPMYYIWQLVLDAPPYNRRVTINTNAGDKVVWPFPFADATPTSLPSGEPLIITDEVKYPYTIQWNLALEKQIGESYVFKATYIGTRGVDLFAVYNPNQKPIEIVNGREFTSATAKVPNPNFGGYRNIANISDQWYNALQLVAEKRSSGGLRFNTSYTWSRNIDTGGGAGIKCAEQVAGASSFSIYNSRNFASEKGLSSIHVAHNFTLSAGYDLPFGQGRRYGSNWSSPANFVLGGWGINSSSSYRTGLPVNISMTPQQNRCTAQGCGGQRPDLIPGGDNNPIREEWDPNAPTIDSAYFDPRQFAVSPLGFMSNLGRNTLIRPSQFNINLSLSKDNLIGENGNLQFRAEFSNFLNHPNFGAPSGGVFQTAAGAFSPTVGRINTTSTDMRKIQFGLKYSF